MREAVVEKRRSSAILGKVDTIEILCRRKKREE
jgi:hypothetical protein